ncbi:DUF4143 domain-containing protein [Coxiella endosymbiont of Ornithodoros amblus]|uniref:DUF4143 domain-containing protein n=1 Tax=Coxiella endosymbiont of Ornithodoros amblus TaxID=1656166 RepID=UPI003CC75702
MATHSAKIISYQNIAKAINLHPNTIADYIFKKEIFYLRYFINLIIRLKSSTAMIKKFIFIDTGLGNAVSFLFSKNKGHLLETIVYQALKVTRKGNLFLSKP